MTCRPLLRPMKVEERPRRPPPDPALDVRRRAPAAPLSEARGSEPRAAAFAVSMALVLAMVLAMATVLVAPAAAAQEEGPGAAESRRDADAAFTLQRGGMWSFFYGYGYPHRINGSAQHAIASGGFRYSYVGVLKGSGLLRGHPSFALEIVPALGFFPVNGEPGEDTFGGGANLIYEHRFAPRGRWAPVWRVGAGAVYTDRKLPVGEERFNFTLLTGLGLEIVGTARGALSVEYRFHHVSNANRGPINPGINAHTVLLGYSFYR